MNRSLSVQVIEDIQWFDPAVWNRLAGESPFRRWEWLRSWWHHLAGDQHRLNIVTVLDEAEVVAILPVYVDEALMRGKVLRFLGSGKACSDYQGVLLKPGHEHGALDALCEWLAAALRGAWGSQYHYQRLDFDGVAARDASMNAFFDRLGTFACIDRRATLSCWQIDLPGDWESYLAMLSKRCRRMLRQLDKAYVQSGRTTFDYVERVEQLPEAMATLINLHSRRRASLGCSGCFSDPHFSTFLVEAAGGLLESNELRLSRLCLDGEPIASGFGLVVGPTYYLYQCGLAPEAGDCKPGWLMNLLHLRQAIADGRSRFDFLRGNEAYKARLAAHPIELSRVNVFAPDTFGRVRQELWKLRAWRRPTVPPDA